MWEIWKIGRFFRAATAELGVGGGGGGGTAPSAIYGWIEVYSKFQTLQASTKHSNGRKTASFA